MRKILLINHLKILVYFNLSSEPDPTISSKANCVQPKAENLIQKNKTKYINKDASTAPTSGGYLAKPSQIYAEEKPKQESKSIEKPTPLQIQKQEDEPASEMQLVVKNTMRRWRKKRKRKYTKQCPS